MSNYKKEKPEYVESAEVKAARDAIAELESTKPGSYSSAYGKQITELADRILSGEKFSYDLGADPLYNVYREQTEIARRRAVKDAASSAALLTGGYANSYGTTAAAEASAKANDSLRSLIPSLVEAAYKKWSDERTAERESLKSIMALDSADYQKYLDALSEYDKERSYLAGRYDSASRADLERFASLLKQWNADRDYERSVYEYDADAAYKAERDAAADALKQREIEAEIAKASIAAAAKTAAAAEKESEKTTTTTKTSSKNDDPMSVISSVTGRGLLDTLLRGFTPDGSMTQVPESFVSKIKNAKKSERISAKEYNALMEYVRKVGIRD